jgi:hypothetical protein
MSLENNFLIEFPANRDYIPYVQDFLRGYLLSCGFSKEFSEKTETDAVSWFNSVIPEEKYLHALPSITFKCKTSEETLFVEINTSDDKKFSISLNPQSLKEAK